MTKAREAVWNILNEAESPLSAAEVEQLAEGFCDTATIYRTLHFLQQKGMADSFVFHCAAHGTGRYYVADKNRERHWFHCEACHRFTDLGLCREEAFLRDMEKTAGVIIRGHVFYATGLCSMCAKRAGAERANTGRAAEKSGN